MDLQIPTDHELDTYPHVFFTADTPWNPQALDNEYSHTDIELGDDEEILPAYRPRLLNDFGQIIDINRNHRTLKKPDLIKLQPFFGFALCTH